MIPVTMGWGSWKNQSVEAEHQIAQQEAKSYILSEFESLQQVMLSKASEIAAQNAIKQSLRETTAGDYLEGLSSGQKSSIRYFNRISLSQNMSAELYNLKYQLLAWHGISLPLSAKQLALSFPVTPSFSIISEEEQLLVLELWYPISQNNTVIGAVRLLHLIHVPITLKRAALPQFNLGDTWEVACELPIRVQWLTTEEEPTEIAGSFPLRSLFRNKTLGQVTMLSLTEDELLNEVNVQMQFQVYFWIAVLSLWVLSFLLWRWFQYKKNSKKEVKTRKFIVHTLLLLLLIVTLRYVWIWIEIPASWFYQHPTLSKFFSPIYLASELGGGLIRSVGDLFITAILGFGMGVIILLSCLWLIQRANWNSKVWIKYLLVVLGAALFAELYRVLSFVVYRGVVDSDLEYLSWTGLSPETIVLIVYGSFLLLTCLLILSGISLFLLGNKYILNTFEAIQEKKYFFYGSIAFVWGIYSLWLFPEAISRYGFWFSVIAVGIGSYYSQSESFSLLKHFMIRGILLSLAIASLVFYPIIYKAIDLQTRSRMVNIAETFVDKEDEPVLFAIERILETAQFNDSIVQSLESGRMDTTATNYVLDNLSVALNDLKIGSFEVSVSLVNEKITQLGSLRQGGPAGQRTSMSQQSFQDIEGLIADYETRGYEVWARSVTKQQAQDRFLYEGIIRIYSEDEPIGWLIASTEQRIQQLDGRAITNNAVVDLSNEPWRANIALAEYRNGTLIRSQGDDFSSMRLPESIAKELQKNQETWDVSDGYNTYYRIEPPSSRANVVIAVRTASVIPYDHLYYLLRISISGIWLCIPFYFLGLFFRRRRNLLPLPHPQFRDKVLDAFLAVGIVAVGAMGLIGEQVITRENSGAIQSRLERRLQRVDEALTLELSSDEYGYQILDEIVKNNQLDSLAKVLSLDLNIYKGPDLVATTRDDLRREHLIEIRLPIHAYEQLYLEAKRNVYVESRNAEDGFSYTMGYKALTDENNNPQYVYAVLTIPEQQRIREERARTTAYLYGALLLLLMIVMATATFLGNAISSPIQRLRAGLRAVARGRFDEKLPVRSKDEVGELVETFNEMLSQLSESRNQLAQQERQLAWNEMARQVAHEIKNPLTPMKLSVQHLQRSFHQIDLTNPEEREKFEALFKRITHTLTEQTDALARIANEFSNFARMPKRNLEKIDLNLIILETIHLLESEENITIETHLTQESLIVLADKEEIRRIFINLAKNAIQAMPDGGRLIFETSKETNWALCNVIDEGTGIADDVRAKVFQPNFSTKTSGMGLGLAIVNKGIVEMNGTIHFETELGKGTTFIIKLPLID